MKYNVNVQLQWKKSVMWDISNVYIKYKLKTAPHPFRENNLTPEYKSYMFFAYLFLLFKFSSFCQVCCWQRAYQGHQVVFIQRSGSVLIPHRASPDYPVKKIYCFIIIHIKAPSAWWIMTLQASVKAAEILVNYRLALCVECTWCLHLNAPVCSSLNLNATVQDVKENLRLSHISTHKTKTQLWLSPIHPT